MLDTRLFGRELSSLGYNFYSGVPCSFLKDLINYAINHCDYIMAANEGDAVATCAGASLAGRKTVFLCQNSGLTNAISPLVSLNHPFRFPLLGFVGLRGEKGLGDEPQHELMGKITPAFLEQMEIQWEYLSPDREDAKRQVRKADEAIRSDRSFFFIVRKGVFSAEALKDRSLNEVRNQIKIKKSKPDEIPSRLKTLETLSQMKDSDTTFLATTGKTGRELFEAGDCENYFYMVGSMGCVLSLALGLALAAPGKRVLAIDGDGSLLMRMGSLATAAYYSPSNLVHLLLDNNTHDSTGGQDTVSHNIDFVELAASVGYPVSIYVHHLEELAERLKEWKRNPHLTFLYLKIAKGSKPGLGRPTLKPYEVKERLKAFLEGRRG